MAFAAAAVNVCLSNELIRQKGRVKKGRPEMVEFLKRLQIVQFYYVVILRLSTISSNCNDYIRLLKLIVVRAIQS